MLTAEGLAAFRGERLVFRDLDFNPQEGGVRDLRFRFEKSSRLTVDHVLVHGPVDRDHAFLRAIESGGAAPVGLRLFRDGKALLVANSNRFAGGPGNATVFDLTDPAKPILRQTIKTGAFPRNITISADGATLYLTVFSGDQLMVLKQTN